MADKIEKLTPEEKRKYSLNLENLYKKCCENGYANDFENFKIELLDIINYYYLTSSDSEAFLENVAGGTNRGGIQKAMAGVLSALSLGAVSLPATATKIAAYGGNPSMRSSRIYSSTHRNKSYTPINSNYSVNSNSFKAPEKENKNYSFQTSSLFKRQNMSKKDITKLTAMGVAGGTVAELPSLLILAGMEAGKLIGDVAGEVIDFKASLKIQSDFNIFQKTSIENQKKAFLNSLDKILNVLRSRSEEEADHFKDRFLEKIKNFPNDPREQLDLLQEAIKLIAEHIYGSNQKLIGKISRLRFFNDAVESVKKDLKRSMESNPHITTLSSQLPSTTENSSNIENHSNTFEEVSEEETGEANAAAPNSQEVKPLPSEEPKENNISAPKTSTSEISMSEKLSLYESLLKRTMQVGTEIGALPTLFYLYKWCEENHSVVHNDEKKRIEDIQRQILLHGEYIYEKLKSDITHSGQNKKDYFSKAYERAKDSIDLSQNAPEPENQELNSEYLRNLSI